MAVYYLLVTVMEELKDTLFYSVSFVFIGLWFSIRKCYAKGLSLECINLKNLEIMPKSPIGTTASTGQKCPESGVWKVIGSPSTTAPISEGNTMPPYEGKAVTWKLIQYA